MPEQGSGNFGQWCRSELLLTGSALWPPSRCLKQNMSLIISEGQAEACFSDTFDFGLRLLRVCRAYVTIGRQTDGTLPADVDVL